MKSREDIFTQGLKVLDKYRKVSYQEDETQMPVNYERRNFVSHNVKLEPIKERRTKVLSSILVIKKTKISFKSTLESSPEVNASTK